MFNNTIASASQKVINNINIQACPGGIYKSHPKSRIVEMHITSSLAESMLSTRDPNVDGVKIVVLQIVNSVEGYILVEYMLQEDYESENVYFNSDGSKKD